MAEFAHRALVIAARTGQPGAAEGQWGEGGLEQEALRLPLVDVVALHHAVPAPHLLLVAGADPAGGVDVEVAAHLAAAEAGAQQQLGRAQRAAGDDRRPAGADGVGAGRSIAAVAGSRSAAHADGPPVLDQYPLRFDSG